jgi:hypothetical protein
MFFYPFFIVNLHMFNVFRHFGHVTTGALAGARGRDEAL